nr:zinc ribbon domain-containing protein [Candidatus Njordarchaeum guaymaensis]
MGINSKYCESMDLVNRNLLLVTWLLASTIMVSFTRTLSPENIFGATTSYSTVVSSSTWVSTSFATTFTTTTLTKYKVTTDVTDQLIQYEPSGPYIQITAVWKETEYRTAEIDATVKNLMKCDIRSGHMRYRIESSARYMIAEVDFGPVSASESVRVVQRFPIPEIRLSWGVYLERAEIRLNRVEYVVLAVPIETLTQIDRRVDVHTEGRVEVYTTTIAYTVEEVPPNVNTRFLLVPVLGIAALSLAALLVKTRKRLANLTLKSRRTRCPCASCGTSLLEDEDYCPKCGMKGE